MLNVIGSSVNEQIWIEYKPHIKMVTALKFHHIKKKFKKVYPTNSKAS